jgi:hypothetical protein
MLYLAPEVGLSQRLEQANYFEWIDGEGSSYWRPRSLEDDITQTAVAELIDKRQKLEKVPHDERELNLPRMASYLGNCGLGMRPIVGVDECAQQTINNIMGYNTQPLGSYFPLVHFGYVLRGQREAAEGTVAIEGSGIHEITHFNSDQAGLDIAMHVEEDGSIRTFPKQCGLRVELEDGSAEGDLLEEMKAEYNSHRYRSWVLGPKQYTQGDSIDPPGAYAMLLLAAKDPHIPRAMLADLTDSPNSVEYRQRIEALSPGLSVVLAAARYGSAQKAVDIIIDTLFNGDSNEASEAVAVLNLSIPQAA